MKKAATLILAAGCAALFAAESQAQNFPSKPVRVIVPLVPGGNLDLVARTVSQKLSESLNQQFVVENRPGASSLVGTQFVAKQPADGYTLLVIANTFTAVPAVIANPGYDAVKDFTGVTLTCKVAQVLVVNPNLPVKNLKELIALAKARPGELTYGSSGNGSTGHFAAELFNQRTGLKMLHVPYKGNAQSLTDIMAGQIMMMYDQVSTSAPLVAAGKLRAIAVTGPRRFSLLPDVPTASESGLPGFDSVLLYGLIGPPGMPRDIVDRLNKELVAMAGTDLVKQRVQAEGGDVVTSSPEEYAQSIDKEEAKWSALIRKLNLRVD